MRISSSDAPGALTFTRGRSQLLGSSVPSSGSVMHGAGALPLPPNIEAALPAAPPVTTGVEGKSLQSVPQVWTVTGGLPVVVEDEPCGLPPLNEHDASTSPSAAPIPTGHGRAP